MLIDLNDELGETVASELSGPYVRADVSDADQVQAAVAAAAELAPPRAALRVDGGMRMPSR